jgi:DNA-binding transcriptional LysR family regulator
MKMQTRILIVDDDARFRALAAQGLGVAIITRAAADTYAPDVEAVKITRPELRARLKLVWRSQQGPTSPAAQALTDHARAKLISEAIA